MLSLRFLLGGAIALALVVAGDQRVGAKTGPEITFTKLWTHGHATPGQVSEIPAFDNRTNTIWVAGVVGVDVLDADTGALLKHIDVTPHGAVNSVAIHNGLAALAVEAASQSSACPSCDRRDPGKVLFYDTRTRLPSGDITEVEVGSLPDMLTFTHDGRKLLVANEATPNRCCRHRLYAAARSARHASASSTSKTRTVIATAEFENVPRLRAAISVYQRTGMDFEPEYIAVEKDGYQGIRHAAGSECDRRPGSDNERVHRDHRSRRQGFQPARQ